MSSENNKLSGELETSQFKRLHQCVEVSQTLGQIRIKPITIIMVRTNRHYVRFNFNNN